MTISAGAVCCRTMPSYPGSRPRYCKKPAKIERDGLLYCGIHDPVALEERRRKSQAAENARRERTKS